ncbi:MAG: cell surface protein SprA, partial [Bacteroidota bacterium]
MNLGSARFLLHGVTVFLTLFLLAAAPATPPVSAAEIHADNILVATGSPAGFAFAPQDTGKPTVVKLPGGKLSRRAKAAQQRESGRGGELFQRDTSRALIDSIRALPRDSSARLEQFKHVRRDELVASDKGKTVSPMYLPDPPAITYKEVLDSLRWSYRLRELLGTVDIRVPIDLSLEDYTTLRLQRNIRKNWALMAQAYEFGGEKKAGLGELFGKVTNIEIPVPKNPLFSIFGPNIIRIQINGAVDIHTAFRNTTSDLLTNSPLGQSRNEPDFNQEVQVSVKGEIGDKLKIDADWNTQRTFEYENQLKVHYTGYEDEIVQSVEAGNVSLPTSSAFISSSQALFGVKAGFQFGPLRLTTVASQKKGQIKELSVSGGSRPTPFEIRPVNYATNHFFVDTSYIGLYEQIFLKIPAEPKLDMQLTDLEIWVTNISTPDPTRDRDGVAFMDNSQIAAAIQQGRTGEYQTIPGEVEVGRFNKLEPTDYTYNSYAGIISLNKSLDPSQVVAVSYLQGDGGTVGTFNSRDTLKLVLKLVRPKNLGPQFKTAWRMMLKNHYPLGGTGIKSDGFELRVEYELPSQPPFRSVLPQNVGLLEMFGLDRFVGTDNAQQGHDQTFDYLSGLTIDETRGELIFPTVEPFDSPSIAKFLSEKLDAASAKAYADSFAFRSLYDTTYYGALNSNRNLYYIRGTIKPSTASTYNLGFNIVEGSVQVVVDGVTATSNVDYTVDYITGQVVIKNQSFLVPGKNLQIK